STRNAAPALDPAGADALPAQRPAVPLSARRPGEEAGAPVLLVEFLRRRHAAGKLRLGADPRIARPRTGRMRWPFMFPIAWITLRRIVEKAILIQFGVLALILIYLGLGFETIVVSDQAGIEQTGLMVTTLFLAAFSFLWTT